MSGVNTQVMPETYPSHDEIERLHTRFDALEREVQGHLREQAERLRAIEEQLRLNTIAPSNINDVSARSPTPEKSRAESSTPFEHSTNESSNPPPRPETDTSANENSFARNAWQADDQKQNSPRKSDLETRIGGKWFNWIGVIALCFGVAFFLEYAFDNNWIGATGRILLGGAGGIALLIGAEHLRTRGYASYSHVLTGGGILILYLSIYAAFDFYKLIEQLPAFLLMSVVTTTAVLLAARNDALTIAILGLIGGFLTPILISTRMDNEASLFTYIALLDAGVLALAYIKSWRSLNHMAFVATVLMFFGWYLAWYTPPKLWLTCFFLTLFFLLFAALAVLHNLLPQRKADWFDLSLVMTGAGLYFGASYELLNAAGYHHLLGSFAVLMSAFYAILFYVAYNLHRAEKLLPLAYLNAAVIFFTLAIAIQLDQNWITIGWALEGFALTYVGLRTRTRAAQFAALAVFFVAAIRWIDFDLFDLKYHATPVSMLLNRRMVSCGVLAGCLFAATGLHKNLKEPDEKNLSSDRILPAVFFVAAHVLLLTAVSSEVYDRMRGSFLAQQLSLSLIWAVYSGVLLAIGFLRRNQLLRGMAIVLLSITILKVFLIDLSSLNNVYRIVSFIVLAAILLIVSFLYQQRQRKEAAPKTARVE